MGKKLTLSSFIDKANEKHNNQFTYIDSAYQGYDNEITIRCKDHGLFVTTPNKHIRQAKGGCPECSKTARGGFNKKTKEQFILEAQEIHSNDYDYSLVDYKRTDVAVKIICDRCDRVFEQTPYTHLHGSGCSKCNLPLGVYSEKFFIQHPEYSNIPAKLYLIQVYSDSEKFIKVGITKNSVKERFRYLPNYSYNAIEEIETTLYEAFQLEQQIKNQFNENVYNPEHKFTGRTECYELILTESIRSVIINNTTNVDDT